MMRVLARLTDGKDYKQAYMGIVENYEKPEDILLNRLKIRKYLRELLVNQQRIIKINQTGADEIGVVKIVDEQVQRIYIDN